MLHQTNQLAWYTDGPEGPIPLVLLHGFCEDSSVWDDTVLRMPEIPVLRMDLPGFGASSRVAEPGVAAWAQALAKVLDAAGVTRSVLVGHSMGGYVALEFARLFPHRVAGLGLYHSHPFADTPERLDARRRGIELLQQGKKELYVSQLFPGLFMPEFGTAHPDCISMLIKKARQLDAESIIQALELMMNRPDQCQTLKKLSCPLMLFLGTDDPLISLEETVKAGLSAPRLSLTVAPGVAHMAMFEAPGIGATTLSGFWKYCTGG